VASAEPAARADGLAPAAAMARPAAQPAVPRAVPAEAARRQVEVLRPLAAAQPAAHRPPAMYRSTGRS